MNAPTAPDPWLALPLDGVRLVEASAGTGKTFTLATLATRLVVERGLRIGQVLAVTYTEAATQELRSRIRERLDLAARLAVDATLDIDDAQAGVSRAIVERHLATGGETREQLVRRLRQAALETDLAAIFTIHGFCARVLRDHALACGQSFDAPTVVTNDAELRDELAADLWRAHAVDAEAAQALVSLWSSPALLARDLRALLSRDPLVPAPAPPGDDPGPALQTAARALCAAFAAHGGQLREDLEAAISTKVLHNGTYKPDWVASCWQGLERWATAGDAHAPLDAHIDRLTTRKLIEKTSVRCKGQTPESPLCVAIDDFLAQQAHYQAWRDAQAVAMLHALRADAHARMDEAKQVRRLQTYDDMIEGVADALEAPGAQALVTALREQYRVALVDEFQDTDPRQWAIFSGVFGRSHGDHPPALFLIGDPKQAIYGFRGGDLETYLAAAAHDATERAPALARNFRSRPAVLRAIECLYDNASAGESAPFVDRRIRFMPVVPGDRADETFVRDGGTAPGLTVRQLVPGDAAAFNADGSRAAATRACVDAIHSVLLDAHALVDGRRVVPGDIAVLVRTHREATLVQHALAAAGIPAVAAGKQSLFATDQAQELLALLESLLQPADDGRLRTALATVLLGVDAATIAALDDEAAAHAGYQRDAQLRRERWQRSGPLALVSDLCAAAAERLLGLVDGERRLTNTLQLAEQLQEAQAHAPGLHAQVAWLRSAIADADANDDAQLLRLESDAARVQVVTLHKSKGLEYPLVFLPFAGIGGRDAAPDRHCVVHDGVRRVLHWKVDKEAKAWKDACEAWKREQRAEDARLLYVGLTRARHALWLATGPFYNAKKTPLAAMLGSDALAACADIAVIDGPVPGPPARLPPQDDAPIDAARIATRVLSRDWWVHSFTQLMKAGAGERQTVRAHATGSEDGAADEPANPEVVASTETPFDPRFAGARFGDVLHDAFEHVDFAAWRAWDGGPAPGGQDQPLVAALRRGGYVDRDIQDGVQALLPLVGHGLVAALPEGIRLCDVPEDVRRAEMEFHFSLQPTSVEALMALLHRHGVLRDRDGFGMRRTLEGLMTGKIDLTYTAGGRWYLLDYKSNRLPAYDQAALEAAMAHSGYDLQALVYTLALHRWLRFRLGARYDYARDFGGVRYLFCRGLAAGGGVHAARFAPELVHALDGLFSGAAA
ncbi:MAG TPA: exodeoxyribonuclease V subunit beta [Xanthomonadaceae bacterium]|nr:exodeoxyribonuclease V subunit beta [Xanthomonadaceae bacterium]